MCVCIASSSEFTIHTHITASDMINGKSCLKYLYNFVIHVCMYYELIRVHKPYTHYSFRYDIILVYYMYVCLL